MIFIVDEIAKVVQGMRDGTFDVTFDDTFGAGSPYYIYGHRQEIATRLLEREGDKEYKHKKYPLVALRLDIPEKNVDGMIEYSLNVAIIEFTNKNFTAAERYKNVFRPTLQPLYEDFLLKLRNSGLFTWGGNQERPEHTKIDRPFWGITKPESNSDYIFADPLDAIELLDLKLRKDLKDC